MLNFELFKFNSLVKILRIYYSQPKTHESEKDFFMRKKNKASPPYKSNI